MRQCDSGVSGKRIVKRRKEKKRKEKKRKEKKRKEKKREEKKRKEKRREEKRRRVIQGGFWERFWEGSRRVPGELWEGSGSSREVPGGVGVIIV